MPDDSYLHGDRTASEDLLNRDRFAALLAEDILAAPSEGGFVFAVMGPYGSGKTTVLDLVRTTLEDQATIVSFEPWMVGSAEQLIGRFFKTFAASMRRSTRQEIRALADRAEKYGQLAGPLGDALGLALDLSTGGIASRLKNLGRSVLDATKTDVEGERAEIVKTLAESDSKWVVFIDDVDRLTSAEIREVIRLVKNVADFPNTVFVLAFDRWNVEHALTGTVRDGREYLEKIIQGPHDLPAVAPHAVRDIIGGDIARALERRGMQMEEDDAARWSRLYEIGVVPYLRTLRLARQWANVAPLRAAAAGPDVSLPDVLAIEAMRVFEPDLFARLDLPDLLGEYTSLVDSISMSVGSSRAQARKVKIEEALSHATRPDVAQALLLAVFPQLSLYLSGEPSNRDVREDRRLGRLASDAAYWAYATATKRDHGPVQALLELLEDEPALTQRLVEVEPEEMGRVINELRDYTGDFGPAAARPSARALCAQIDRTAYIQAGFFGGPLAEQIMFLVQALVAKLDPQQTHDLVEELATTGGPYARFWAIRVFGDHGGATEPGQVPPVLGAAETGTLKQRLADDVAQIPIAELAAHPEFPLFLATLHDSGHNGRVLEILQDPVALPVAFRSLLHRWFADRNGEREMVEIEFDWDRLVALVGGEEKAKAALEVLEALRDSLTSDQLLALDQAKNHRGEHVRLPFHNG